MTCEESMKILQLPDIRMIELHRRMEWIAHIRQCPVCDAYVESRRHLTSPDSMRRARIQLEADYRRAIEESN
jgi:hypothetical protein